MTEAHERIPRLRFGPANGGAPSLCVVAWIRRGRFVTYHAAAICPAGFPHLLLPPPMHQNLA